MPSFDSFALQFSQATAEGLAATGADVIITESGIASGAQTLSSADLATLARGGQTVLAYVNTSVTDATRSYWNAEWITPTDASEGDIGTINPSAPAWLSGNLGGVDFDAAHAGPDALIVDYRNADWRALVIAQAVAQVNAGYGGVFLDDVGRYYEAGHSSGTYDPALADAMMQLVIDVAAAVRAVNADAVIVVNSGVYIGGDSTGGTGGALFAQYRAAIGGVLVENSFDTGANAVWTAAQSLYPQATLMALESLGHAPDIGALLDYASRSGLLVQIAPDEGYDDAVTPPVIGTNAADTLSAPVHFAAYMGGGVGNDTLTGGNGSDTMFGHAGADWLFGGGGRDSILGGSAGDTVYGGASADAIFGGSGGDRLYGGTYHDQLDGGSGNDRLYGGSGNDTITGGSGSDRLGGGTGRDHFVFASGGGHDRITDFKQGSDLVDLTALDTTWAKVQGALHLSAGSVRLDLAQLGGSGWVDFSGQTRLSDFSALDFILS